MKTSNRPKTRRVLIASSHSLFAQGLRSLLRERQGAGVEVVGVVSGLDEALSALERLTPDLIIVDYDDESLNRDEFLAKFVEGEKKLRVVLLSLQSGSDAIVYDRRTLAASQIDTWLEEWSYVDGIPKSSDHSPNIRLALPGPGRRINNMKHIVTVVILVLLVTAVLIFALGRINLLPVQASAQAVPIDNLFGLELKVIAFLFSLIIVFMLYSMVFFRRKPGDTSDAANMRGNNKLEIAWTVAPLVTVLVFAYLGSDALAQTLRADPQPLNVKVVASQWAFRFEYPDSGIVATDLVLPVNKQVLLSMISTDVIHNFWVPQFRVKQDILPGGDRFIRTLRITPTQTGEFTVMCAQLCGLRHAYMTTKVKVLSQSDYDAWVASQTQASNDPVARGQKWAQQFGCLSCHSITGVRLVGPSWKGLAGSQVTLVDGTSVTADDAYLIESTKAPAAKVVQGYPNIMPASAGAQMSDAQLQDLIAYIKSLK